MTKPILKFLKKMLCWTFVLAFILPLTLITASKAQAEEKVLAPAASKIILKENPEGANDFVYGLPGAVEEKSTVQIATDKAFANIVGTAISGTDGSFMTINLGDNSASAFFLRASYGKTFSLPITLANDITPPVIKGLDNLKTQTFSQGESIKMLFAAERGLKANAYIGGLDSSFPVKIGLSYVDSGTLQLLTPPLSENLQEGIRQIKIIATDKAGNIRQNFISVNLKALPSPAIIYVKTGEGVLYPSWQLVKGATAYRISWQEVGGDVHGEMTIGANFYATKINRLKLGTAYRVTVAAVYAPNVISKASSAVAKTAGIHQAEVLGTQAVSREPRTITPAIGGGVSTEAPKIAQVPQEKSAEAPTEKTQEGTKGGWNRLLIALSILIIAAGIAVGGYYGYEWMNTRSKEDDGISKGRW